MGEHAPDARSCDSKSIDPIATKFRNLSEQLAETTTEAEKLLDAAKQIKNEASEEKRLAGMKQHYQKTKVYKLIKPGHFNTEYASVIAEKIHAGRYIEAATAIDPKVVQLYTGEVGGKNIPELVKAYQSKVGVNLEERAEQLSGELLGHSKKRSIQAKLEHANTDDPASWLGAESNGLLTRQVARGWWPLRAT